MGALCGYRFGQTRICSEPGGGKIGAEERETCGRVLVNSWREVRSQRPLVWVEREKDLAWECLGTLGYVILVAFDRRSKGLKAERRLEIRLV